MRVTPLRGYRYGIGRQRDLTKVVAPPYDQISPRTQDHLYALSPENIVRVSYARDRAEPGEPADKYVRAHATLDRWLAEGVWAREEWPAIYPYTQTYRVGGREVTRAGFVALGEVSDYARGIVRPHERTHAGPKQDRLRLLEATGADIGLIFMLTADPGGALREATAATGAPVAEARDLRGELHRLWRITDAGTIARVQALMASARVIIADGHHRYETAVEYARRHQGGVERIDRDVDVEPTAKEVVEQLGGVADRPRQQRASVVAEDAMIQRPQRARRRQRTNRAQVVGERGLDHEVLDLPHRRAADDLGKVLAQRVVVRLEERRPQVRHQRPRETREDRVAADEARIGELRDAEHLRPEHGRGRAVGAVLIGIDEPGDRNRRLGMLGVEHEAEGPDGRLPDDAVERLPVMVERVLHPVFVPVRIERKEVIVSERQPQVHVVPDVGGHGRILDEVRHVAERAEGVGQGRLPLGRGATGQRGEESLPGRRPRPRAAAPGPFLNDALAPDDRRLADLDLDTEGGAEPGRVPGTKRIVEVMTDPPERLILLAGAVLEPFRHAELGDAAPENRISAFGLSQIFDQRSVEIARCSRCPQREVAMRRDLIGGHRDWCDDCQDQQEVERGRPHCRFSRRRGVRPSRTRSAS